MVNCDAMTTEEAIEAMEAVGHDFYMFRDTQSKGIQVGRMGRLPLPFTPGNTSMAVLCVCVYTKPW